jgi:hypothetical protein
MVEEVETNDDSNNEVALVRQYRGLRNNGDEGGRKAQLVATTVE